jgi:hypothetical protein
MIRKVILTWNFIANSRTGNVDSAIGGECENRVEAVLSLVWTFSKHSLSIS